MARNSLEIIFSLLILLYSALLFAPAASGQAPSSPDELERRTQTLSENLMSPFCPGRTISSCPSPQARALRSEIRGWVEKGYSDDAVQKQLLMIYGKDVRGAPEAEGFGLVGWWMPAVFMLVGATLIVIRLRRLKGMKAEPVLKHKVSPEVISRVEQAMRNRQ